MKKTPIPPEFAPQLAEIGNVVDVLAEESEGHIKTAVTTLCDRNGWDWDGIEMIVYPRGHQASSWRDQIEGTGIPEMFYWYRDTFGRDVCDNTYREGEWLGL